MSRDISADLGANLAGVGYQFFSAAGSIGARVTAGISNPRTGIYYKAATDDTGAIGVYWDDGAGTVYAVEVFDKRIDLIQEKTALLGTGQVVVVSPVSATGSVTLVRGDDYADADGRALEFASGDWPVLTGGTVLFKLANLAVPAEVTGERAVRVELIGATHTSTLTPGIYDFELEAVLANGHEVTIFRGRGKVVKDL